MSEYVILALIIGFVFHKISKLTVIHLEFGDNQERQIKTGKRKQLKK